MADQLKMSRAPNRAHSCLVLSFWEQEVVIICERNHFFFTLGSILDQGCEAEQAKSGGNFYYSLLQYELNRGTNYN